MSADFQHWAQQIGRLQTALAELVPVAAQVGVPAPVGQEWHELLVNKLRPQVEGLPLLVVAVVGGTNIGKSSIFNHLAGEEASGVSPLAAGTRHPVCLVPPALADESRLEPLFESFELRRWHSSHDPLDDAPEHRLYWRASDQIPPRLLLLDTPDIDSDVEINWHRADCIRQSADVLIGVLTQQKYNDAAVKQFFRKAVESDKPVVVVFNQCDLTDDREYWPEWLATFTSETGAHPELVYVVPYDRAAARERRLPFYEVGADGRRPIAAGSASSLREELAALHFDAIKIRTLRGALERVLDVSQGAPAYLRQVVAAAAEFEAAQQALGGAQFAPVDWPTLPPGLLVDEIRTWWDQHRSQWSRSVHRVYRTVGQGLTWPIRATWRTVRTPSPDVVASFMGRERVAIVLAVQKLLDELDRLAQVGNDTLRPRLLALLGGEARRRLLERIEVAHAALPPVDDDYRAFLQSELDRWKDENPRAIALLRSLDHVLAFARPAITVTLVASGMVVAGGVVHEAALTAATHTVTELATEAAVTGGITGGGELAVASAGEGVQRAAARLFRRLQVRYAQQRAQWLAGWLEHELLGDLIDELRRGAAVPQGAAYRRVEAALDALRSLPRAARADRPASPSSAATS